MNYGFGYVGVGFAGGHWAGNSFAYNTAVNNVNTTVIHNTYNTTVVNNVTVNKVSFNGGAGGVAATPTAQERAAAQEQHVPPTPLQRQHVQEAIRNPALSARTNAAILPSPPRPDRLPLPGRAWWEPMARAVSPAARMAHPMRQPTVLLMRVGRDRRMVNRVNRVNRARRVIRRREANRRRLRRANRVLRRIPRLRRKENGGRKTIRV